MFQWYDCLPNAWKRHSLRHGSDIRIGLRLEWCQLKETCNQSEPSHGSGGSSLAPRDRGCAQSAQPRERGGWGNG